MSWLQDASPYNIARIYVVIAALHANIEILSILRLSFVHSFDFIITHAISGICRHSFTFQFKNMFIHYFNRCVRAF